GRMALGGTALAALSASALAQSARRKPISRIAGVQVGVITSSFAALAASEIIPAMLKLGLSEVELQPNHAEAIAGAPMPPPNANTAASAPQSLTADGLLPRCANQQMVVTPPLSSTNTGRGGRGATP